MAGIRPYTVWDVLASATAGPLQGRTLPMVQHVDTFWFAWAAFLPSPQVIRG